MVRNPVLDIVVDHGTTCTVDARPLIGMTAHLSAGRLCGQVVGRFDASVACEAYLRGPSPTGQRRGDGGGPRWCLPCAPVGHRSRPGQPIAVGSRGYPLSAVGVVRY